MSKCVYCNKNKGYPCYDCPKSEKQYVCEECSRSCYICGSDHIYCGDCSCNNCHHAGVGTSWQCFRCEKDLWPNKPLHQCCIKECYANDEGVPVCDDCLMPCPCGNGETHYICKPSGYDKEERKYWEPRYRHECSGCSDLILKDYACINSVCRHPNNKVDGKYYCISHIDQKRSHAKREASELLGLSAKRAKIEQELGNLEGNIDISALRALVAGLDK